MVSTPDSPATGIRGWWLFYFFIFMIFPAQVECTVLDRIIAVVEAQNLTKKEIAPGIVTDSELNEIIRPILEKARRSGTQIDFERVRKMALDELILRRLREQMAQQLEIVITEDEIDELMSKVERDNHLPAHALPEVLLRQGVNLNSYRQNLRDQLLQSRLIARVIRNFVTVSEEEIEDLYQSTHDQKKQSEEIQLGQIVLNVSQQAQPDEVRAIQEKALFIKKQLEGGASLSALASQYSDDFQGIQEGGIDWFKRGELLPELENAVFGLKQGEVTDPIRSVQGYHLFQLLDRRLTNQKEESDILEKVHARHILLKVASMAEQESVDRVHEKILAILKEYRDGASFSELAKKYSEDGTAEDGGDLGYFTKGMMVAEFDEAVFALKQGQVSEPVRTPFGWHLILLEERQALDPNSLESRRANLKERIGQTKIQSRYQQWLRDLRLRAYVEIR
ncbi:MAG: peptidylprolyl isomerase [Magnetococcus sp. DMHC-6]